MTEQEIINKSIEKLFNTTTDNYIFIYTPPKVGSTTLVTSLRVSLGKSYNVIHIHDEIMLSVLTGINNVKINDIINYLTKNGKKVYVIDVYRTPIERKMSEFFEKISPYHFNNTEQNINTYSIKRVSDRFNKLFPHLENGDHYFEKYDIQNPIPFDFNKKYTVQEEKGILYIKFRLCDSHLWGSILSTILKTDIIIITDYKTDEKGIGKLYNKFKLEYRIPSNFLENIKQCKYFNFYYNEEERNKYLITWQKKMSGPFNSYSNEEYKFYMNLCLENQYINDIQVEHYIDNGCFCNLCKEKRRNIYFRAKNGETRFEKIIHNEVVNKEIEVRQKKIIEVFKEKSNKINSGKKFLSNQFKIKLKPK
jgi:hypothetical protein